VKTLKVAEAITVQVYHAQICVNLLNELFGSLENLEFINTKTPRPAMATIQHAATESLIMVFSRLLDPARVCGHDTTSFAAVIEMLPSESADAVAKLASEAEEAKLKLRALRDQQIAHYDQSALELPIIVNAYCKREAEAMLRLVTLMVHQIREILGMPRFLFEFAEPVGGHRLIELLRRGVSAEIAERRRKQNLPPE
jgi:hypothetical protein